MKDTNKTNLVLGILVLVAAGGLYLSSIQKKVPQMACTMEAKLCPDGSSVGRSGPKCEFAACPTAAVSKAYKNISYKIDGTAVLLADGMAVQEAAPGSASKITTTYFGNEATGDLDGNGTEDVAFLLTQNAGGSGTFYYVVAAVKTDTGYVGTNAILLGDRIAPQTTEISNGVVTVNYAIRKTGDPMTTAPSVGVSKKITLSGGGLVEMK